MNAPLTAPPLHEMDNPRVLIVDDNSANLAAFEAILAQPGLDLVSVRSGRDAMRHLLGEDFAVILLDINMPGLDGLQTAKIVHERERSRHIPIIFITAFHSDQRQIMQGYASGAVDFLLKPVSAGVLKSKVAVFVDLFRRKRQVEWQAAQLREANARLLGAIAGREEALRDALFEREERQRVTLSCVADAVVTTDLNGLVTYLNGTAERFAGISDLEARGLPVSSVLRVAPDQQGNPVERAVQASLREGRRTEDKRAMLAAGQDARYVIEYAVAPLHDRQQRVLGAAVILRDITARCEAETERDRLLASEQRARKEAEDANRAKDDFLATMSHELRTPLNAIVGWTHVLRRAPAGTPQHVKAMDAVLRNAAAQNTLIEDLLDTSRIMNGKIQLSLQPVDLPAVVKLAVETVRPGAAAKHIHIEISAPACDLVIGDARRLQQVVWNLLSNAVKFTPDEGRIEVQLASDEHNASVRISDTGQGITAQLLPHIFERFRQGESGTARKHGGLGLGLAIVHNLVELHRGVIRAESEGSGKGSTFTVWLPLMRGASPASDPATVMRVNEDEGSQPLQAVRVLVVVDDVDTAESVAALIGYAGAEVRSAGSVAQALAALSTWTPNVLVSDISMPGEDGYSLIAKVRALPALRGGSMPAIALTALASERDRDRALAAGYQLHLVKPVEPQALIGAVAKFAKAHAL